MKRAGTFGCCVLVLLSLLWSGAQAEVTGREQEQIIATETHETLPNPGSFDFSTRTVTLNSGYTMPINGLGTYSLHGDECINAVKSALQCGVRLIDTASAYGNEEEIGQAIRESMVELGIQREEIFVITKIYPGTEMANPEASIQACLDPTGYRLCGYDAASSPGQQRCNGVQGHGAFCARGQDPLNRPVQLVCGGTGNLSASGGYPACAGAK